MRNIPRYKNILLDFEHLTYYFLEDLPSYMNPHEIRLHNGKVFCVERDTFFHEDIQKLYKKWLEDIVDDMIVGEEHDPYL